MTNINQLNLSTLQMYLMDMAQCESAKDIFSILRHAIKSNLTFEDCIVLNQQGNSGFEIIAATTAELYIASCSAQKLFTKACPQSYIFLDEPYKELELSLFKNALVFSVVSDKTNGLYIFTNVDTVNDDAFVDSTLQFLLLQQGFFNFKRIFSLNKGALELQTLVDKFKTLACMFKELGSEWFWRTDTSMQFRPVQDIEMSRNIYTDVFMDKKIEEIISVNEQKETQKWCEFKTVIDKRDDFYDFEFEITSDKELWVSLSGKAQYDLKGDFLGYLGIAKNITQSKEREVALQAQKHKAIEASKTKSKFLSVMSHEIRTPIHAVIGMIELLLDTDLTSQQQQLVNYANSSTEILYALITDVLDFSKIESGTVLLINKPFNIKLLCENIVGQLNIIEKSDDIIFSTHIDESLSNFALGDEYRLGQILFNVIGNAFKFTKSGQITLSVKEVNKQLVFEVEDSGIGIAKKNLDFIFEPFSQVNDVINRKSEGVGLGLSISKNLAELMGGHIDVNTQQGLGSTFTVCIPYREAQESVVIDKQAEAENTLSILVAEDNKTNQVLIKAYLEKLNHKVTLANDGSQAIDLFQRKKFDLVLMDVMMPIMDGLSAAEYIRNEIISDIPIYALTANAEKENRASCFKAGMNKVLTKPLKLETLKAALNELHRL